MTYGEFAWKDLMSHTLRERPRTERAKPVFVAGVPVPFREAGHIDWSWRVRRQVKHVTGRVRLQFVVTSSLYAGRRFAIDDLCKPVLDVAAPHASSVWATIEDGDKPGVRITEGAPPYPPRIDRTIDLASDPGDKPGLARELAAVAAVPGDGPLAAHLTLGRVEFADFGYRTPVRRVLDALSPLLGGTFTRPADVRIRELRVVRDGARPTGACVRLWQLDG